ncbi:hypothetical protein [Paraburkholderia sp. J8-2]|uniref:hypothetical protein n=1 Tax=Paraburkholderia sp. J8-2 TaxID=2805440 RepID=UPI002AB6DB07|nr:hypothetical protein [Paraburkholderia sp. J8-2]
MAVGYREHAAHYVARTHKECTLEALDALLQLPEGQSSNYGVGVLVSHSTAQLLRTYFTPTGPFANFNFTVDPAGRLPHATINNLIQQLTGMPDAQHQARVVAGRQWANFAARADERFRQIRFAEGRDASEKLFSNLRVVDSSPVTTFNGGTMWLGDVMDNAYRQGCCTLLAFYPTNGGSGHEVAVHQTAADTFHLFDPNYGTYQCSAVGLRRCLQQLFVAPYTPAAPTVLDGGVAVYRRRDSANQPAIGAWGGRAYTILERIPQQQ